MVEFMEKYSTMNQKHIKLIEEEDFFEEDSNSEFF
jgi:hypothetical protein